MTIYLKTKLENFKLQLTLLYCIRFSSFTVFYCTQHLSISSHERCKKIGRKKVCENSSIQFVSLYGTSKYELTSHLVIYFVMKADRQLTRDSFASHSWDAAFLGQTCLLFLIQPEVSFAFRHV